MKEGSASKESTLASMNAQIIVDPVFGAEFEPVVTSKQEFLVFSDYWKCFNRLDL